MPFPAIPITSNTGPTSAPVRNLRLTATDFSEPSDKVENPSLARVLQVAVFNGAQAGWDVTYVTARHAAGTAHAVHTYSIYQTDEGLEVARRVNEILPHYWGTNLTAADVEPSTTEDISLWWTFSNVFGGPASTWYAGSDSVPTQAIGRIDIGQIEADLLTQDARLAALELGIATTDTITSTPQPGEVVTAGRTVYTPFGAFKAPSGGPDITLDGTSPQTEASLLGAGLVAVGGGTLPGQWVGDGATISLGGPIGIDTSTGAQTVTVDGVDYPNVTSITVNDGTASLEQSVITVQGTGLIRLLGDIEGDAAGDFLIGRALEGFVMMWDGGTWRFSRGADSDAGAVMMGSGMPLAGVQSSPFTAALNTRYPLDLSGFADPGNLAITLPPGLPNDRVAFYDRTRSVSSTRTVTISGALIEAEPVGSVVMDLPGASVTLEWLDSVYGYVARFP